MRATTGDELAVQFGERIPLLTFYVHKVKHTRIGGAERKAVYCVLNEVHTGLAVCRPPDRFNRLVGEKIALKRALGASGWDKDSRRAVWQAYFRSAKWRRVGLNGRKP